MTIADFGIGIGFVTSATIMTDTIFSKYGGDISSLTSLSTAEQRNAAYAMAEQTAMRHLSTYLEPTTITGTFSWPLNDTRVSLPIMRVLSILGVTAIHEAGCDCADDAYEISGCAWLLDGPNGIIDLRHCSSNSVASGGAGCNCASAQGYTSAGYQPKQSRVILQVGFPTGLIASSPQALLALTIASKLYLQQIVDPSGAEGGPGDPGLTSFSDSGYSESRAEIFMTAFGNSPEAIMVARLLGSPFKKKSLLRFR